MVAQNEDKTRENPSLANLKKGKRFSSEYQPENRRKKEIKTVLKGLGREVSPEVEARIYEVMLEAVCCKSSADATIRLRRAEEEQPDFGWIYQETIRAIQKDGLDAILSVLERIFGKKTNLSITGSMGVEMKPLIDLTKRKKNGDNNGASEN
jgi:hypothetical protein